jgi:hypothetical protein
VIEVTGVTKRYATTVGGRRAVVKGSCWLQGILRSCGGIRLKRCMPSGLMLSLL